MRNSTALKDYKLNVNFQRMGTWKGFEMYLHYPQYNGFIIEWYGIQQRYMGYSLRTAKSLFKNYIRKTYPQFA